MIPRLLNANVTDFAQVGIPLTDTEYCKVKEERNGVFELELRVATTTPYFEELEVGKIIVAKPNHDQGLQAFEIYEITRPILQRVTVRANHISYRTSFIPVKPFSCTGITETLNGLITNSMETNPFTFNTTITNEQSTYNQTAPASLRSRLGGTEGSVLDVFGGEYKWDNYTINLLLHRGQDNGVELRVAKNISDLEQTKNLENVVTGALPYWSNEDGTVFFYGDIQYNSAVTDYEYKRTVVLDLSDQFETAPTSSQLNSAAVEYLSQSNLGIPTTNIKLSFVDLADTDEYKDSPLERVNLCDVVNVLYYPLLISFKAKVISLTFDVLAERTLEVEVGDSKSTISKTISDLVGDVSSVIKTGKKLVSVTQKIDRELGEVRTTVASVQQTVDGSLNHITYLYAYGDSATKKPSDSAFTYSTMPPLVDGKYIWRMSLAYTNESPTSNPTKTYEMIQGATGPQGESGGTGPQGPQGEKGDKGDKGDTGDDGVSVTQIDNLYYLKDALLDISLNGNTTQGANPSPSSPQAIHTVTGNNEIRVVGKNVLNPNLFTNGTIEDDTVTYNAWASTALFHEDLVEMLEPNTTYSFSYMAEVTAITSVPTQFSDTAGFLFYSPSTSSANREAYITIAHSVGAKATTHVTFTTPATFPSDYRLLVYTHRYTTNGNAPYGFDTIKFSNIQIEKGSLTDYEPYKAQVYPINLGSIELNALGNYKDYFYKSDGKWYLHKAIDKVDIGTLTWVVGASSDSSKRTMQSTSIASLVKAPSSSGAVADILCTGYAVYNLDTVYKLTVGISLARSGNIRIYDEEYNTTATGFASARKGVMLYYALATPTETEITDETLISQLNALQRAMSYDGGTSILQTNSDNSFAITYEESALTRPSKPTAEVTSMSTLPEVWSLQTADYISGYRFYTCLQIHYDNNTLTWTDVVEDKSLQDVREKIVTMSTDIIQNTEAINLKADSSTVEQGFNDMGDRIAQTEQANADLQIRANSISSSVSETRTLLETNYATKSELTNSVNSLSTTIQQTAQDIQVTITDVQEIINSQGSQITTLETYLRATSRGLEISRSNDEINMVLGNSELGFFNRANVKLAWLNTDDGLGANALSIGDANTASNRWRVFTRENGSHLTFTRHS